MYNDVGIGVFPKQLNIEVTHRLPDHCGILQAEIAAIRTSNKAIRVITDSKADIKSLSNVFITSKFVLKYRISLKDIERQFEITLMWLTEHNRKLYNQRICAFTIGYQYTNDAVQTDDIPIIPSTCTR